MLSLNNKTASNLFERYQLIEELIGMNARFEESHSVDTQIELLLECEQQIIAQLAEQLSANIDDLKRKIKILFAETDLLGTAGCPNRPIEKLASSILKDLESLTDPETKQHPHPALLAHSA